MLPIIWDKRLLLPVLAPWRVIGLKLCGYLSIIFLDFARVMAMTATSRVRNLSTINKAVMKPFIKELTLQCSDGMKIAAQSWSNFPINEELLSANVDKKFRCLCLHGWMDNCRSFHHLGPAIVQHMMTMNNSAVRQSCQVVALDLPGHGLSSHKSVDTPPSLLSEGIFYIHEAIRQLRWNDETIPFTVIGHSMGAGLSVLYTASFPEYVERLVLLEGGK
jgi:alpha/beta hydrolase fold